MSQTSSVRQAAMDCPSRYLIRVIGELDTSWLDNSDEISMAVCTDGNACTISTICTHRADQAAVLGLLNSLYDFGYPVIYFERL